MTFNKNKIESFSHNIITDYHTHILPGIDDGARSTDESVRLLRAAQKSGIKRIYATPHFYAHQKSVGQRDGLCREQMLLQEAIHTGTKKIF